MSTSRPFTVFSGRKSEYLAKQICEELGCQLGNMIVTQFADGEFAVSYESLFVVKMCSWCSQPSPILII